MTKLTKPCSACGLPKPLTDFYLDRNARDGHKARCKLCQNKRKAELYAEKLAEMPGRNVSGAGRLMPVRSVKLLFCPDDAVKGVPLFPYPRLFSRGGFQETLAAGFWPTGAVFEYSVVYRSKPTRWRASGCYLHEVGTDRVAVGVMKTDDHVSVKLMPMAAKGVTR